MVPHDGNAVMIPARLHNLICALLVASSVALALFIIFGGDIRG